MYKYVITVVVMALFGYGISFGQSDNSISATYQDDLSVTGSPYSPCGNMFSCDFEFDIKKETVPFTTYAIVYPQVCYLRFKSIATSASDRSTHGG